MKEFQKHGMSPQDIRNALHLADLNQAAIARKLKVSPSLVSRVIDNICTSRRVHAAIADAIGEDIKIIWPNLYLIPGRIKVGRPTKNWDQKAVQGR